MLAITNTGHIPLDYAIHYNPSPAVVSLLLSLTAARRPTIARTALLLCIKHCYVYPCRRGRAWLDTEHAFRILNDDVWPHIMTFL